MSTIGYKDIIISAGLVLGGVLWAADKTPVMPMTAALENSAEHGWLSKKVLETRLLDDMTEARTWSFRGQGTMTFPEPGQMRHVRVEVNVNDQQPAARRSSGLPAVTLKRAFPGEDWSRYNRISFWVRPDLSGFPMLPLLVVMRNDGAEKVPDVYRREGNHYVMLPNRKWTHVVWEITPLARDKVTSVEFVYWVNKRIPDPGDSVAFDVGRLELERVEPDNFEGWTVAPGKISFSHTGYQSGASKSAIASGLAARDFSLIRVDGNQVVLTKPVRTLKTRLGEFQEMDFSEARKPGTYIIQAGAVRSRPFRIDQDVWTGTIWKSINFFFGERCGFEVPGIHDACHSDWQAVLGDKKIIMNGGWHDAGDLSQGLVNTGEATYAMFALARRLERQGVAPELRKRLLDEAKWGLAWVLKVRFDGGYRIGFAGMNIWTNGIIGDADDRTRLALNNPNVNYIAAAAEAVAYNVLKGTDPELTARSLRTAEDDWRFAVAGKETPENLSTPAFAASEMELASIGILASLELFQATGHQKYAEKAQALASVVVDSQQRSYVGREFPLAGFFYTGPAKERIFHQFHRGNDQAPIVAMAKLCETFPNHRDWIKWYSVVALYSEYQKASARTTEPYGVLPAYVYRDDEYLQVPQSGDRYQATPEAYREQVLGGMPMGEGYYLKAFPVWFARRGNYGVLLSQAKGLSTAAHLRGDRAAADLAQKQLEWVVGRNPFVQSTMWGEGYDFAQQYSVSSGDIVGSLPVGMMTRGNRDLPYWPSQNCYVYKEVWVHSSARWLWLMEDLNGAAPVEGRVNPGSGHAVDYRVTQETNPNGEVTIRLAAKGSGKHTFSLRTSNLAVDQSEKERALPGTLIWTGRVVDPNAPWVGVVIPDGDLEQRQEVISSAMGRPTAR